jgi:hypothetical protein
VVLGMDSDPRVIRNVSLSRRRSRVRSPMKKEPNQSPEPTSGLRPAVAHL